MPRRCQMYGAILFCVHTVCPCRSTQGASYASLDTQPGLPDTVGTASLAEDSRWRHITSQQTTHNQQTAAETTAAVFTIAWAHVQQEPSFKVRKRLLRLLPATAGSVTQQGLTTNGLEGVGSVNSTGCTLSVGQRLLAQARGAEERAEALSWLGHELCVTLSKQTGSDAALDGFCQEVRHANTFGA